MSVGRVGNSKETGQGCHGPICKEGRFPRWPRRGTSAVGRDASHRDGYPERGYRADRAGRQDSGGREAVTCGHGRPISRQVRQARPQVATRRRVCPRFQFENPHNAPSPGGPKGALDAAGRSRTQQDAAKLHKAPLNRPFFSRGAAKSLIIFNSTQQMMPQAAVIQGRSRQISHLRPASRDLGNDLAVRFDDCPLSRKTIRLLCRSRL